MSIFNHLKHPGANFASGAVAVLFSLGIANAVAGEPTQCVDDLFRVEADDTSLADSICLLLPELRDALGSCELTQHRPLAVEVVDDLSHPLGDCLAYFDCDYDLIRVTAPEELGRILAPDQPYKLLPTDVLFRALLTHELTHALVTQSAGDQRVEMVDQEYVAAAMELELMSPEYRDIILKAAPVDLPPKEGLIDIWIYGFAPRKFAVNAWQHFRAQEDGCGLVQEIVAGEKSFVKKARP